MLKSDLRNNYLEKMKTITPGKVDEMSGSIARLFFDNFKLSKEYIHIFLTITKNNEVNTFFILRNILQNYKGVTIAVPKSDFVTGTMKHYRYDNFTKLCINKLGIPEPQDSEEINAGSINIVLVPLLCFDRSGYRVGYGKGFYDRFLSEC